ncbi:MAG: TIGR01777 family oxidoreductase [Bacteroidota bacterium]
MKQTKSTVLIAGGSGLIGQRLSQLLVQKGYRVLLLSRRKQITSPYPVYKWDISKGFIDPEAIQQADFAINLAGAGIADRHWTKKRKQLIIDSRVKSNQLLASELAKAGKAKAYIAAAAIGYYGNSGMEWVDEESLSPDHGFLTESCQIWESTLQEIAKGPLKTTIIRIGIVLSTQGGALEKMLLSFKARVGTYFGDGSQIYSWIHIDDLCRLFIMALENEAWEGVFNGVAPEPVSNKALVEAMGRALEKKSLIVPAPAFALRLAMGEMADMILFGSRVSAEKVQRAGFQFQFPEVENAIRDLLQRNI